MAQIAEIRPYGLPAPVFRSNLREERAVLAIGRDRSTLERRQEPRPNRQATTAIAEEIARYAMRPSRYAPNLICGERRGSLFRIANRTMLRFEPEPIQRNTFRISRQRA